MILTNALCEELKVDISQCDAHTNSIGSEALYNVLVAKYSVIDVDFAKNLSINGKTAVVGSEFDYTPELKAISAKLKMWLVAFPVQNANSSAQNVLKEKVGEFIKRGEEIQISEHHPAQGGFPISYVSGPKLNAWMGEINIFNERYLKNHPLYSSISTTYFHYKKQSSSCEDMLGYLEALASDGEFLENAYTKEEHLKHHDIKHISQMLSEDIVRCQQYIADEKNESLEREIYLEITGRYDSIIKDFGNGLYSYFSQHHFYDPDISISAVRHNLKLLLQKMISYQSAHYSVLEPDMEVGKAKAMNKKVFIVHGHDTAAKLEVARTLEKAGFEAIILHEQANAGNTIIEKIEIHTDVAFAIVLYTPCDIGRATEANKSEQKHRARQNVVFEHGYLIGKLGRKCVSALVKGNVETPGDISGVVYISMDDAGAWKMALAKEMENAGLSVDRNQFCS